jgi:hypothetical protein
MSGRDGIVPARHFSSVEGAKPQDMPLNPPPTRNKLLVDTALLRFATQIIPSFADDLTIRSPIKNKP